MRNIMRVTQRGFTLVELVMVIILIGVLSVGASSLFASRDAYSAFVAKDQLIAQALFAQQIALGGYRAGDGPVTLSVGVNGAYWEFVLTKPFTSDPDDDQVLVRSLDATGGSLIIDGTTLTSGSSQIFTWDADGNLTDNTNHSIQFIGDSSFRVCLSAAGFAYESAAVCP